MIENYRSEVEDCLNTSYIPTLKLISNLIKESKGTIYILGNGGSLSTAQHLACDLSKSTGKPIRTDTLSDLPKLTAYANDEGYEFVYQSQLFSKLRPGDVIFNISNSGNSKNLVNASLLAKDCGNLVVSFLGYSGGVLKGLSDYYILTPSNNIRVVEDVHMIMCHMLTELVEKG